MDYQEAVAAAAGALRQGDHANWELARLTHTHTLGKGEYQNPGTKVRMGQWCKDVEGFAREHFSLTTGRMFRAAWEHRITRDSAVVLSFNEVLRELKPDSYDPATVQARVDAAAVEKLLSGGTPEDKAATLARLLGDPAVLALAVPFGSPLSRALADAIDTQRALREDRAERIIEADPVSAGMRSATALTRLTGVLSRFAEDVAAGLGYIRDIPDPAGDPAAEGVFLREALIRAESAIASVRALVATGHVGGDVDHFVRGVLHEEER